MKVEYLHVYGCEGEKSPHTIRIAMNDITSFSHPDLANELKVMSIYPDTTAVCVCTLAAFIHRRNTEKDDWMAKMKSGHQTITFLKRKEEEEGKVSFINNYPTFLVTKNDEFMAWKYELLP